MNNDEELQMKWEIEQMWGKYRTGVVSSTEHCVWCQTRVERMRNVGGWICFLINVRRNSS